MLSEEKSKIEVYRYELLWDIEVPSPLTNHKFETMDIEVPSLLTNHKFETLKMKKKIILKVSPQKLVVQCASSDIIKLNA